jgi:hypothetical protein
VAIDSLTIGRSVGLSDIRREFPVTPWNWNRANVATFSDEIHYRPMILAALQMVEREFRQFASPQSATQQDCQHGSVPFTF